MTEPVEKTLGHCFEIRIHSRRWGNMDTYRLTRIATGWHVDCGNRDADCGKDAMPMLFDAWDNDLVNYPQDTPGYLEFLWTKAESGLTVSETQDALDDLSDWITACETMSPMGVFKDFK